jgi:hypothetical protein
MTQDQKLIALAVQADLCDEYGTVNYEYGYLPEIIAYGKLVATKEREACARLIEDYKYWLGRTAKEDIAREIRARGEA